jgi:hypothetical protein
VPTCGTDSERDQSQKRQTSQEARAAAAQILTDIELELGQLSGNGTSEQTVHELQQLVAELRGEFEGLPPK